MTTRYHLDTEGWDTVVEMINWCLNDIDGMNRPVDEEEAEYYHWDEVMQFKSDVEKLADRMGLTPAERKVDGS